MNITNEIARMISEMLEEKSEIEFKRNLLAESLGCVPSQINYVLSSRFTPESGFLVESRRGGDGCIKITRLAYNQQDIVTEVLSQIGESLDAPAARNYTLNLVYHGAISQRDAGLMLAAVGDASLGAVPRELRDKVRSAVFRQLLFAAGR